MTAVVAVSTSPALDVVLVGPTAPAGRPSRLDRVLETAGGKAAHAARIAAQLGTRTLLVAPLGGAAGEDYARLAAAEGIELRAVPVAAPTRRTWAHVDPVGGDRSELHEAPSALTAEDVELLLAAAEAALRETRARVLVVAGSRPSGAPEDLHARLVALAHAHGAASIVDTSDMAALRRALAERPAVAKPNRDEAAALLGRGFDATDIASVAAAAREVRALGAAGALISLGADGAVLATAEGEVHLRAPAPAAVVNAIGCGDAVVGGIAAGLAAGEPLERAARLGIAAATDKVGRVHPAEIDAARVRALAASIVG